MTFFDSVNANSIIITIGFIATFLVQRKSQSNQIDRETAQIYKENAAAKDAEMASMRHQHDKEISTMQADIKELSARLEFVQQQNNMLKELVTGKEALEEIKKVLTPIPALFEPNGFMETVLDNQEKTLKTISEVKAIVDPERENPPKREFSRRRKVITALS